MELSKAFAVADTLVILLFYPKKATDQSIEPSYLRL